MFIYYAHRIPLKNMDSDTEYFSRDVSNDSFVQLLHKLLRKHRRVVLHTLFDEYISSNSSKEFHVSSMRRYRNESNIKDEDDIDENKTNNNINNNEWLDIIEIKSHVIPFVRSGIEKLWVIRCKIFTSCLLHERYFK